MSPLLIHRLPCPRCSTRGTGEGEVSSLTQGILPASSGKRSKRAGLSALAPVISASFPLSGRGEGSPLPRDPLVPAKADPAARPRSLGFAPDRVESLNSEEDAMAVWGEALMAEAEELLPEAVALRRRIHANPELGLD